MIVSAVLGFAYNSYSTHVLNVNNVADFTFCISLISVLSGVLNFGTHSLININSSYLEQKKIVSFHFSILLMFQMCIILIILTCYYSNLNVSKHIILALFLISVGSVVKSMNTILLTYLRKVNKFRAFSLLLVLPYLIAILWLVNIKDEVEFNTYLILYLAPLGLFSIIYYVHIFGAKVLWVNLNQNIPISDMKFGVWSSIHVIFSSMLTLGDRYILFPLLDKEIYAGYAISALAASGLALVYTSINQTQAPELYCKLRDKKTEGIKVFIIRHFFVCLFLFVFAELFVGVAIDIVYPIKYAETKVIARYLLIGIFIQSQYQIHSSILLFFKKSKLLTFITMVCGVFSLMTLYTFYSIFGVFGLVSAFIINWGVYYLITSHYSRDCRHEKT